jgi:cytochrome c oxidase cbb3-type subunit 3
VSAGEILIVAHSNYRVSPLRLSRNEMIRLVVKLMSVPALALCGSAIWAQHDDATSPSESSEDGAATAAGRELYQQICAACHGAAGGGGPGGASNLSRSRIVMVDDGGVALHDFLSVGRPEGGMPPFAVSAEQAAQLSAAIRSFSSGEPLVPSGTGDETVLVGDAAAGLAYFNGPIGKCSSCHAVAEGQEGSATNLAHVASRFDSVQDLQNAMVLNRSFFWSPALDSDVTAEVTYADGRVVTGYLTSVSDFKVVIRNEAGRETEIRRVRGEPQVELHDRLQHHLDLLEVYRDEDIHNLTAYLATLK